MKGAMKQSWRRFLVATAVTVAERPNNTMGADSNIHDRLTMRACPSSYAVFGAFLLPLLILAVLVVLKHPTRIDTWEMLGIVILVGGLAFWWLSAHRLTIVADRLSYSRLFGGTVSITFHEIVSVDHKGWPHFLSDPIKPPFRLDFHIAPSSRASSFYVNLKVFCLNDVHQLIAILRRRGKL